jgi:hypothetical protein
VVKNLISPGIESAIKKKLGEGIEVEKEHEGLFRVDTPFGFDDGDSYLIFVEKKIDGYVISDRGHTLMHMSYWTDSDRLFEGRRGRIFNDILSRFGLQNDGGAIKLITSEEKIGESVYSYIQALDKITDMEYLDREQIRSLFIEDVVSYVLDRLSIYNPIENWFDRRSDPEGNYRAHVALQGRDRLVLVYALASDNSTRDATIFLYHLAKTDVKFKSVGIFRDQVAINGRVLARFTDICDRHFSSFSTENKERFVGYVSEQLG